MTTQRPYLKRPDEFYHWKRFRNPSGIGTDVMNYPGPLATEIWCYVRSIGRVRHPAGWRMTHRNDNGFILHVVQRGAMWYEINRRRYRARVGEACLLDLCSNPSYGVDGKGSAEIQWALINGRDMPRLFLELGADQDPIFPLLDLQRIPPLMSQLQSNILRESPGYEARAAGLMLMIMAELFASRGDRLPSWGRTTGPMSEPVRKGVDYIIRFYDKRIPIKHIAFVVGQSLSYFSRRFHQEMGTSPIEFLNRYRIEQARKLLANGNQSIATIARSVGFANENYFRRTFARIVGKPPLAFRKKPR